MQSQKSIENKRQAPQDWLGLSILVSTAIFVALFVLSQVGQFIQDSNQQQKASEIQNSARLQNLH